MRTIEVDEDVYASLQRQAEAFVDTPNDVLRRVLLGRPLDAMRSRTTGSQVHQGTGGRVSPGQLLPHGEYRIPILRVLAAAGGALPVRAIIDQLRPILADRLTPLDLETLPSAHVARSENRAQCARFAP